MPDREGGEVIWKFGTSGICGVLIAAGVANAEESAAVIRVRLWNYAEVPPRTLADAKRHTSAILERARVRVEWAECRLREGDGPKDSACLLPVTPLDLQMRILDRRMAKRARSTRGCLGYALLTDGFDSVASVFFQRAVDLESGDLISQSSVLGAMMAHEIGHLLLDQGHHPDAGILRASWSKEDMRAIARSQLHFTDAEGQLMRSMVAQRERSVSETTTSLATNK